MKTNQLEPVGEATQNFPENELRFFAVRAESAGRALRRNRATAKNPG
jgi:hypothetical protein